MINKHKIALFAVNYNQTCVHIVCISKEFNLGVSYTVSCLDNALPGKGGVGFQNCGQNGVGGTIESEPGKEVYRDKVRSQALTKVKQICNF